MNTPPPPDSTLGLPLSVWTNLPLLVCLIFAIAIFIGFLIIMRENKRIAAKNRAIEDNQD